MALVCLQYEEGGRGFCAPVPVGWVLEVPVDLKRGTWTAGGQTLTIGQGVRVPEGDALFGPAFVYDDEDPTHLERVNQLLCQAEAGHMPTH